MVAGSSPAGRIAKGLESAGFLDEGDQTGQLAWSPICPQVGVADIRRVQEWMGHADIQTTMKYLHYAPRAEDARLVAEAGVAPFSTTLECFRS